MTHLVATISSHGLGHLAQSAPVLNALRRRLPGLRLTVASMLPAQRLHARIEGEFRIEARALDIVIAAGVASMSMWNSARCHARCTENPALAAQIGRVASSQSMPSFARPCISMTCAMTWTALALSGSSPRDSLAAASARA